MKKLICFLIGFLFIVSTGFTQPTKPIPKSNDTITVVFESPKTKLANDHLANQLAKNVENQALISNELANSIRHVSEGINNYLNHLKTPIIYPPTQIYVLSEYGYYKDSVQRAIKRQRMYGTWYLLTIFGYIFLLFGFNKIPFKTDGYFRIQVSNILRELIKGISLFTFLYILITLLFNYSYIDIIILSKLLL